LRRRNRTPPPQGESADGLEDKTDTAEEKEITFTEQVVADNEECKITITGFERYDEWEAFYIYTVLENKSSDKTYCFSLYSAAVNGVSDYLSPGRPGVYLAPGEKRDEKLYFSDRDFNFNDIGGYTDIELVFRVQVDDFRGADVLERKAVHIYPYGEDKAAEFVREAQPSDKIVLDNEYATLIFAGEGNEKFIKENSDIIFYKLETFVINKTDKRLWFKCPYDSLSVNGFKVERENFLFTYVDGGKCSFDVFIFYKDDLEKIGIKDYEDFEEIKFKLEIYDLCIDDYGFHGGRNNTLGEYEITLNP
jgi:hypothetical protein